MASASLASHAWAPVARMTDAMAASGATTRNGTTWQREAIVGRTDSAEVAMRMNTTPAGGSSMVLSSAFADASRRVSARSST